MENLDCSASMTASVRMEEPATPSTDPAPALTDGKVYTAKREHVRTQTTMDLIVH